MVGQKRESEVMSMLDGYYSQEDVTNMMLREAEDKGRREGEERGEKKEKRKTIRRMLRMGKLSCDEIAEYVGVSVEFVEDVADR